MRVIKQIFSEKEFLIRHKNLLKELNNIDMTIIFNRPDLTYYSSIGLDGVLIVDENINHYVKRNLSLARLNSKLEVHDMASYRLFRELGKNRSIQSLGLELDLLPYKTVKYITKAFDNPEILDISPILRNIRSVKSNEEQNIMRQAAKQTDDSFQYAAEKLKPGITELELSAEIEHFLRRQGHPGYVQIRMFHHNYTTSAYVMSGESTRELNHKFGPLSGSGLCLMHLNGPSKRKIQNNEAILIDTTGVVEGYTADETRTFILGNIPKAYREALEISKEVQRKTENILVEGNKTDDIYQTLIDLVRETGLLGNFMGVSDDAVQFLGHGTGLELDELPIISPRYKEKLIAGQTIAVEPKFLFDSPRGGVGIEDTWIVGSSKAEKITKYTW